MRYNFPKDRILIFPVLLNLSQCKNRTVIKTLSYKKHGFESHEAANLSKNPKDTIKKPPI